MGTVSARSVEAGEERVEELPERVREALGELAGAAKDGLLALSVGVGLGVLHELMAAEVDEVVGPKGRHDPDRSAVRHGHEAGEVTLGGRRVPVTRPRVRIDRFGDQIGVVIVGADAQRVSERRARAGDVALEQTHRPTNLWNSDSDRSLLLRARRPRPRARRGSRLGP